MRPFREILWVAGLWLTVASLTGSEPLVVETFNARRGIVVAGHPQAAAVGLAVLKAGGNAIDAGVATALAVGVAEPYGSGLGGKLVLLYYEAASGRTFAVDALDACGSAMEVERYRQMPEEIRSYGYGSVCVPGFAAGLWLAHEKWGRLKWSECLAPAIDLAREGFLVLPKSRDFFAEQLDKLQRGDLEIARLYLPAGELPAVGSTLKNEDLAKSMELLAAHGRDGFYRGPVAEAILRASAVGGGLIARRDLESYRAVIVEPVGIDFRGFRLLAAPPPTTGAAIFMPTMKALEEESFAGGPLRTTANLDRIGRIWRVVASRVSRGIGDVDGARIFFEKLVGPDSINAIRDEATGRARALSATSITEPPAVLGEEPMFHEDLAAATTHWLVADAAGNIVCATQSQSLHFGAGVVVPGTGIVMNNSMGNFAFNDRSSPNFVAPGKRSRSTIAPTIVFRSGKPVFAIGLPGAARIPTAMLQVLLDRLTLNRPLADAIGDTRFHFARATSESAPDSFAAEKSLPETVAAAMSLLGWRVDLPEVAGQGRYFGGVNAIEFNPDGSMTGLADPRRTNAVEGF